MNHMTPDRVQAAYEAACHEEARERGDVPEHIQERLMAKAADKRARKNAKRLLEAKP